MWDPQRYLRFADERGRPFHELLARVAATAPAQVVDLGCGPGNLTATLAQRWPGAQVTGVDSSPQMVAAALERAPGAVRFVPGDVRSWQPEWPVDVLVTNATLQWVPNHLEVLPRLVTHLAADGWLALQVPGNFDAPSHVLLHELLDSPRWRAQLGDLQRPAAPGPAVYLEVLSALGLVVDAWETTYLHVLPGEDAVLRWVSGTALRPVLAALSSAEAQEFCTEYGTALRSAYPARRYGTVLPYRRTFAVAHREAS